MHAPALLARIARVGTLPLLLTLGLAASACGGDACDVGEELIRTELFFGLDRENGEDIQEEQWRDFVDTAVTPRFQEGLTMFDADGQYLMDNGNLVHEKSKVIILLHNAKDARSQDIDAIREEYKRRFDQESVLRIDSSSCVAF